MEFKIGVPEVIFKQGCSFSEFVGQFQPLCPKILCVINENTLHYYERESSSLPSVRFEYKQQRGLGGEMTEYYFRAVDNDDLFCVIGREAASFFYPRIDQVDPIRKKRPPILERIRDKVPPKEEDHVSLQDMDQKLIFPSPNYPVEITYHSSVK